jgi:hypothetical protein
MTTELVSGDQTMVVIGRSDFEELLDRAVERGAARALAQLGLENGHAAQDIGELRDLLEAFHDARRVALRTVVRLLTTGILAALLVGLALKLKYLGGTQ